MLKFKIKLVTRTGFEPMNVCVKGICVNRFTNGPLINGSSLEREVVLKQEELEQVLSIGLHVSRGGPAFS